MASGHSTLRRLIATAFAPLLVTLGFVWGYFAHRDRVFPYSMIRRQFQPERRVEAPAKSHSADFLQSLPYIGAAPPVNPRERGVTLHRREAFQGLSFYSSRSGKQERAYLIDMDGRIVHTWRLRPGDPTHTELLPNGDLISAYKDDALVRVNARSEVLWETKLAAHHDFWIGADGLIYTLTYRRMIVPGIHPTMPLLADSITVLTAEGRVLREISLLEAVARSPYAYLLPRLAGLSFPPETEEIDVLHANHVERVDGRVQHPSKLYAPGNLLVSMRHLNAIAILDGSTAEVLWLWGPSNVTAQHHPRFLPNGNILLFDNGLQASQIIEVDPRANEVRWRYAPQDGFFSRTRGANQRLPNGNTLITESDRGTVFEVTPEGKMVWRFVNPDMTAKGDRRIIRRMTRYTRDELPILRTLTGQ